MSATTTHPTEPITGTLEVPTAVLTYDVRPSPGTTEPPLLLIGSPMAASGFGALASFFPDRTIATYDPRGSERSRRTDGATETVPDEHADDLHRLIEALGFGPLDVFASSGGAVNALALVARHPEDVRILVAHEPPALSVLPDRDAALAATRNIRETYLARGFGPAMAKFIVLTSHQGPIPDDFAALPDPDPTAFGLPATDDGSRDDALVGQNIVGGTRFEPDVAALRSASTRIVIGVSALGPGTLAHRSAAEVAHRLGTEAVTFPSHHAGFVSSDGPYGGEPEAFATVLRDVLEREAARS